MWLIELELCQVPQVLVLAVAEEIVRLPASRQVVAYLPGLPSGTELGQNFL